jgi:GNAT superfamily N-acetyltransferase
MDQSELLDLFTRQQRIELGYPDMIREEDGSVIRLISQSGDGGFVIYSRLDETNANLAITAQITRFEGIPQDFEWKYYDYDSPPDLLERLRRRGFEIGEPEALVALDLAALPPALSQPVPASVVRVTDPAGVSAIVALENAVWQADHQALGDRLRRDLTANPALLSVYISYEGQQPASAAWTYFQSGAHGASLYGGATLPQFRGRGHYSHLLAVRAQEARARGVTLLTVDASPMSRPILEKHGFQYLATTIPCTWAVTPLPKFDSPPPSR